MDVSEAISVIGALKGRYQAIEKLDEVLVFVQQSQAKLGDTKREIEKLTKSKHDLELEHDKLKEKKEETEKMLAGLSGELQDAMRERDARVTEYEKKIDEEMAASKKGAADAKALLNADMETYVKQHASMKASLEKEIKDLEARRASVMKMLEGALGATKSG
jgi:chromosome segregation ATPase